MLKVCLAGEMCFASGEKIDCAANVLKGSPCTLRVLAWPTIFYENRVFASGELSAKLTERGLHFWSLKLLMRMGWRDEEIFYDGVIYTSWLYCDCGSGAERSIFAQPVLWCLAFAYFMVKFLGNFPDSLYAVY